MEHVKPRHQKEGNTLRIVAHASSMDVLDKRAVERSVENQKKLDLNVDISPSVYRRHGHTCAHVIPIGAKVAVDVDAC